MSWLFRLDASATPESHHQSAILTYIEDDELLEDEEAPDEDPEFDPDLFLWKKSSLAINEPDFSSGNVTTSSQAV